MKSKYKIHKETPPGVKISWPEYGGVMEVKFRVIEPFKNPINGKEN